MEAPPNGTARVRMNADGIGDPDKPIVISFTGRLLAGSHGMINISAGDSQFAVYISLNEGLITVNGLSAGQYTEGGQHNMLLAMFPASDTFELIFTGAVLFGNAISGPLNNPSGLPGSSYALKFELEPMPDGGVYIVDNPRIRSRNF